MNPLLIQRPATGLLDLLGLKAMGQGPVQLAETVALTLADCVDYYVATRRSTIAANTPVVMAANTQYTVSGVTVPAGEIWLVYAFAATLDTATAAATAIRFTGGFARANAIGTMIPLVDTASAQASDNDVKSSVFTRPLIWLPGDTGIVFAHAVTGAPNVRGRIIVDAARLTL